MSSPEVEKFEITAEDFADELNPGRKKYKRTKNQATFGMPSLNLYIFIKVPVNLFNK